MPAKKEIFFPVLELILLLCLTNCNQAKQKGKEDKNLFQAKIDGAISCTSIGLLPADSILYMQNGGREFKPTIVNNIQAVSL